MTLKVLMTINAIFAFIFGLGFLLVASSMLSLYGATPTPELLQMTRFFGSALFGYGILTWFARGSSDPRFRRAICLSLSLSFAIGFVVAITGQLTDVVSNFGWFTVALYLFFAVGYVIFLKEKPE